MVYDPNRDMRPGELFHCYMRGWRHGASTTGMDPKFTEHENPDFVREYNDGYKAGYLACKETQKAAAERLGYEPSILRIQEGE